ncbi:MAG: carbohydrate kinase family protein [Actinobacteria bacterium]|nr:carbohydrate kinase family protein [Actinomycetota bacterium]MCG2807543.1 carbohydrate kinase family protein [Coriobacteriia bacterium]
MSSGAVSASQRVVVVGGANTDIVGTPGSPLVARDSNPAAICSSPGGVGRNMAENLVRLGVRTSLVTAFGADEAGTHLEAHCRELGMDTSGSLQAHGVPGSRYVAILDDQGDMALAMSDMRALELLTPAELDLRRELIQSADLLVTDANLAPESLAWLAENARCPILFDPVSTAKSVRVLPIIASIDVLKCNIIEAAKILGIEPEDAADAASTARRLCDLGAKTAVVTAGQAGAFWVQGSDEGHAPAFRVGVVNATGAGDAFSAGIAYSRLAAVGMGEAVRFASALAALTLMAEETVSRQVSLEAVDHIMKAGAS